MKRWNGAVVAVDKRRRIEFTPELLFKLGASGKTILENARGLKVSRQLLSEHINKNLTNSEAYRKGKAENNVRKRT